MRGKGIERSPYPGDVAKNLTLRDACSPLELHMLDPMRQPCPSWSFVSAADAVPGPDGDDGCGVILFENDPQPVAQLRFDHMIRSWWRHDFHSPPCFPRAALSPQVLIARRLCPVRIECRALGSPRGRGGVRSTVIMQQEVECGADRSAAAIPRLAHGQRRAISANARSPDLSIHSEL